MIYGTWRAPVWRDAEIPISRASLEERRGTIVVADADPDLRAIYRTVLEHHGHRVVDARDGLEALELVRALTPEVVLLDLDLPHLNGLEAARLVCGNRATTSTSVILLSVYTGAVDQVRALRAGCAGYLPKPFEPRHLIAEVRRALAPLAATPVSPTPAPIQ